jgi:hypothetical protein
VKWLQHASPSCVVCSAISLAGWPTGAAYSTKRLTIEKIVELAAMPSASVTIAAPVNTGFRRSDRKL